MPEPKAEKDKARLDQRLAYLESMAQTKLGLQSSNRTLTARRAFADADETRNIDIQLDLNDSEWSRVNAAETAYHSRNVQFNPPTTAEVELMKRTVRDLDAYIASSTRAQDIIAKTATLVQQFEATQPV